MTAKANSLEKTETVHSPPWHAPALERQSAPSPLPRVSWLAGVQQAAGNLAIQRLVHSGVIQAKLAISQPGDVYEQEADRIAEQVVSPAPARGAQGKCAGCSDGAACPECEEKASIQANGMPGHALRVSSALGSQLPSLRGGGEPLASPVRAFFEPRFGLDFSQVRVHTGGSAAQSARSLNALAYTVGSEIVFADGRFAPQTDSGRRLIAHELVHTVQQGGGGASRPLALQADHRLERGCPGNNGGRHTCVQRLADDGGTASESDFRDDAGPSEARAALIAAVGEDKVRLLEGFGSADQSQNGSMAAMRAVDPASAGIIHTVSGPAVMPAGAAAVIGGVAAAILLCAVGWFLYTYFRYEKKSDKWKHCFASCKIASYCGGSAISLLIGGGKEVADWVGDLIGVPMQAEWEDFIADAEGAFLCGFMGIFGPISGIFNPSCYDCCEEKRGGK